MKNLQEWPTTKWRSTVHLYHGRCFVWIKIFHQTKTKLEQSERWGTFYRVKMNLPIPLVPPVTMTVVPFSLLEVSSESLSRHLTGLNGCCNISHRPSIYSFRKKYRYMKACRRVRLTDASAMVMSVSPSTGCQAYENRKERGAVHP